MIRINAPYIVGFQDGGHRVLRDGCVVVEGDSIVYVGSDFPDEVSEIVDLPDTVITPGLISTHSHLHESPVDKSVQEDIGNRQFWLTGLIEILPGEAGGLDEKGMEACIDYSMAELLSSGTTTVMQMGPLPDYVAEAATQAGIRAYISESYRSARWYTPDGLRVDYEWDAPNGEAGLRRAIDTVSRLNALPGGRIRGFLNPSQVDTCTEGLLRSSSEAAASLGVPLQIHAAQGVFEFNEIVKRHGRTPIEWLHDIGLLGPRTIIGHGIFTTAHSWINFAGDDLTLLAESGTHVSYNAWCFARRGLLLESFPKYLDAGINVCLGTDTASQSMIESLKWTAISGKIVSRRADTSTARRVFDAATIGAASALGRPDLGRLAAGAKADLVAWRTDSLAMAPLRDPIRNIVYYAQSSDVHDVMVGGEWSMRNGQLRHCDTPSLAKRVQRAGERVWSEWPKNDRIGRTLEQMCPSTYPAFNTSSMAETPS